MLQITVLALEGSAVDLSDKLGAVNLTGFIAEAVSLLTMIVAACVAAYVIFRVLVPKALGWLGSAAGGSAAAGGVPDWDHSDPKGWYGLTMHNGVFWRLYADGSAGFRAADNVGFAEADDFDQPDGLGR